MKKVLTILLILVLTMGVFAACTAKPKEEASTEAPSKPEAVEQITEKATEAVSAEAETVTEELTTEAPAFDPAEYNYIQNGVWYLYDEDAQTAYTFSFVSADKVEIAYFNSDNTQGLDAKYFTTGEGYSINDVEGEIILELDDPINADTSFMFTLHDNAVFFGKDALIKEKEVSLDTVFTHFNP